MIEIWPGWVLTTDHPASTNDTPVLISPTGRAYNPEDIETQQYSQSELADAMGISRGAIHRRMKRGTLPEYDGFTAAGRGYWMAGTVKHLIKGSE